VREHDIEHEQDIEQLRHVALAMHVQIGQLVAALTRKCKELEALKGSRDELQQTLALIDTLTERAQRAEAQRPSPPKTDKPRAATVARDAAEQPQLPVVDTICELSPDERVCDLCGGELGAMKGPFEESELVDVVEVEYHVKRVLRQKYACRCGGYSKTAPGLERAQDGGRYSLDFALKVILDKYLYHLPLARQTRMMAERGLVVTPQALWDQLYALAERLKITVAGLVDYIMQQPVIGLDQTSWPRLDGAGTKPCRCGASPRRARSFIASATTRARRRFTRSSATTRASSSATRSRLTRQALARRRRSCLLRAGLTRTASSKKRRPSIPKPSERCSGSVSSTRSTRVPLAIAPCSPRFVAPNRSPCSPSSRRGCGSKRRSRPYRSAKQRRTRSPTGIGSRASSTIRGSRSITTPPSAESEVRSSGEKSLRLEVAQRHAGRVDLLQLARDREAARR
jgi:hypothetical protein